MKLVKNLTATGLLILVLAVGSYAGDQQTPGLTAPPPSPTQQTPGSACVEGTGPDTQTPCIAANEDQATPNPLITDVITTLLGWF